MKVFLAELEGYDPVAAGVATLYFSSDGMAPFPPTDPDRPNQAYDARLQAPANLQRTVFSDGRTAGRSQINGGEIVIANPDGVLDHLLDWGLDGRALRILWGDQGAAWAEFKAILVGTMEQPLFDYVKARASTVRIRVRDRQDELDVPLQTSKYAGTNSGSTGDEGTPDDVQGRPKPTVWGEVLNITPVPSNSPGLRWQVHDGPIEDVPKCYDQGVELLKASAPPSGGEYSVDTATGIITLGASPAGTVTCDVKGDQTGGAYVDNVPDLIERIVTERGGFGAGDLDTSSFAALEAANSAKVGLYVPDELHIAEALDLLCASIGAYWTFGQAGQLTVGLLEAPAAPAALTLTEPDIVELRRQATRDPDRGVPVYRVILAYQRNWTVQDGDALAAAVGDDRRAWLEQAARKITATDTSVQTKHLLARELERETLLLEESDADDEADRLETLYGVRRDSLELVTELTDQTAALDLMSVVALDFPRFGLGGGKLLRVLSIEKDHRTELITLGLWG